jgi:hypothetical protein
VATSAAQAARDQAAAAVADADQARSETGTAWAEVSRLQGERDEAVVAAATARADADRARRESGRIIGA